MYGVSLNYLWDILFSSRDKSARITAGINNDRMVMKIGMCSIKSLLIIYCMHNIKERFKNCANNNRMSVKDKN